MATKALNPSSAGVTRPSPFGRDHAAIFAPERPLRRLIADSAYDADLFRASLREAGAIPVIPVRSNRNVPFRHDRRRYRERWQI